MKYIFILAACWGLVWVSCTGHKSESVTTETEEWPQMDEFHLIMAESFHPFKDSGNLEPARRLAAEMAAQAAKWATSSLPEKVNTPEVSEKISRLKSETEAFAALVQSGSDAELAEKLNYLHDLFHEIQEAWYGKGKHHHQH